MDGLIVDIASEIRSIRKGRGMATADLGRRLGPNEHVVTWPKPERPAWMDEATYQALPAALELREVRVQVR